MTFDEIKTILSSLLLSAADRDVNQDVIEKVKILSMQAL